MAKIVSIHSFRGGTGKSNLTANLAAQQALAGMRVGVIDTDIQSPGLHAIFRLDEHAIDRALNDYLWGKCRIEECAYDVTEVLESETAGQLFLIPSALRAGEIAQVLKEGYDVGVLTDGFQQLIEALNLDMLFIDTHPGVNEETLLSIAVSDALIVILRADSQDWQGTAVTMDLARRLEVPQLMMLVNKLPRSFDADAVRTRVESTYKAKVAAMIPLCDEIVELGSGDLFSVRYPQHPVAESIRLTAQQLARKK